MRLKGAVAMWGAFVYVGAGGPGGPPSVFDVAAGGSSIPGLYWGCPGGSVGGGR